MNPTQTVSASHGLAGARVLRSMRTSWLLTGGVVVLCAAVAKLMVHLYAGRNYGYFTDELYYLACGRHLAWGYVDQPPLIAAIAWAGNVLFGESVLAIRILPALAGRGQGPSYRPDCAGNGRREICAGAGGACSAARSGVPGDGQPALDERLRAAVLAGLRLRGDPHYQDREPEALAVGRTMGRPGAAEQAFDAHLRVRPGGRAGVYPGEAVLSLALDLAGSADRACYLSAQPGVEHPAPFSISRTAGQHPARRTKRGAGALDLLL